MRGGSEGTRILGGIAGRIPARAISPNQSGLHRPRFRVDTFWSWKATLSGDFFRPGSGGGGAGEPSEGL
ncbi:unnamed protein product [Linum tenue]|uniref:Uncharacterized protein n=1 Tax=Linum tenue TaxID=586396 RepID=A0AAV0RSC3_9ROSI|nr:unnamed protein product [Linum tenue]CAI0559128.1 unnamed protein product [Linum tenue]